MTTEKLPMVEWFISTEVADSVAPLNVDAADDRLLREPAAPREAPRDERDEPRR